MYIIGKIKTKNSFYYKIPINEAEQEKLMQAIRKKGLLIKMNLIITAGGTRERIDSVRTITNEATGRLGSLIAKEFSQRLSNIPYNIYYLCGQGAAVPEITDTCIHIIRIEGTDQLLREMKSLLTTQKIDAVVHSMAVSDYKVGSITTLEMLAEEMQREMIKGMGQTSSDEWMETVKKAVMDRKVEGQKISSELEHPLLLLEKTPKIIEMIKETCPHTLLVGFKLLSGVSRDALHQTALKLLQKNNCDFVLANDTETIKENQHIGYLVKPTGEYKIFQNKEQIAEGIADAIIKKYTGGLL
jgi:Phosphopantothenoylcysteine synthetase/decarboxylase